MDKTYIDQTNNLKMRAYSEALDIANNLVNSCKSNRADEIYWETYEPSQGWTDHYNVYHGNCGILLFLNEIYKINKNPNYLQILKKGAQWLKTKSQQINEFNVSLFFGHSGIIYTLSKLSHLDPTIKAEIKSLIEKSKKGIEKSTFCELLHGLSGYIISLQEAAIALNTNQFDGLIFKNINVMLEKLQFSTTGIYFDHNTDCSKPIISFSHGTSGLVKFFSNLYKNTKHEGFKWIIQNLLCYEDSYFNEEKMNWPDFRSVRSENSLEEMTIKIKSGKKITPSYSFSWCHGAPGIALSRIEWYKLNNDQNSLIELKKILLTRNTNKSFNDPTLCCGLSGVTSTLLELNSILKDNEIDIQINKNIALILQSKTKSGNYSSGWSTKIFNNGLFKGETGIGYTLLNYSMFIEESFIINPSPNRTLLTKKHPIKIKYNSDFVPTYTKLRPNIQYLVPYQTFNFEAEKLIIETNNKSRIESDLDLIKFYKTLDFPYLRAIYKIHSDLKATTFDLLKSTNLLYKNPTVFHLDGLLYKCTGDGALNTYNDESNQITELLSCVESPISLHQYLKNQNIVDPAECSNIQTSFKILIEESIVLLLPEQLSYISNSLFNGIDK